MSFRIDWIDAGRESPPHPDPAHPHGVDLHLPVHVQPKCRIELPYPARRCGMYLIRCDVCNTMIGIATAGRADDPRSVELACKRPVGEDQLDETNRR